MSLQNLKKVRFLIFSLFLFPSFLHGETFRIHNLIRMDLTGISASLQKNAGVSDAVFITLPQNTTFIEGIEITLKIPEVIATWRDSVAYTFYDGITPLPDSAIHDYTGEKIFLKTIPSKLSQTLYVPVSAENALKTDPYSVKIWPAPDYKKGIYFRFQQVMKGVPEELEKALIEVNVKPVLKNQGILNLNITASGAEEKNFSVYIDDAPVQNHKKLILKAGEHHLSVVSDSYRNEVRTFIIEQAKTTSLEIELTGSEPSVKIICPHNTSVLLDGKPFTPQGTFAVITPGDHTVKFSMGDYEVTKTFSAVNGRSYTINLNIDASVTEED